MMSMIYWTPIEMGLPTDPEMPVLVAINRETWIATYDGERWRDLDGIPLGHGDVTHWGDLPELKKTGEQNDDR